MKIKYKIIILSSILILSVGLVFIVKAQQEQGPVMDFTGSMDVLFCKASCDLMNADGQSCYVVSAGIGECECVCIGQPLGADDDFVPDVISDSPEEECKQSCDLRSAEENIECKANFSKDDCSCDCDCETFNDTDSEEWKEKIERCLGSLPDKITNVRGEEMSVDDVLDKEQEKKICGEEDVWGKLFETVFFIIYPSKKKPFSYDQPLTKEFFNTVEGMSGTKPNIIRDTLNLVSSRIPRYGNLFGSEVDPATINPDGDMTDNVYNKNKTMSFEEMLSSGKGICKDKARLLTEALKKNNINAKFVLGQIKDHDSSFSHAWVRITMSSSDPDCDGLEFDLDPTWIKGFVPLPPRGGS